MDGWIKHPDESEKSCRMFPVRFYRTISFNLESKILKTISEAKSNLQQKSEKRKKPIKLEGEHKNRF